MAGSAADVDPTVESTAEKEDRNFRDLPPEVWLEVEGAPPGDIPALPSNFMTLAEARESGEIDPDVLDTVESKVWHSVVKVVVPAKRNADGKLTRKSGTGFVVNAPGWTKHVLTNYHVLEKYRGDLKNYQRTPPISINFFFDTADEAGVEIRDVTGIEYFSLSSDKDDGDFAMLSVDNIPQRAGAIPLSTSGKRKRERFQLQSGIIVSHPRGRHKRVTRVQFTSGGGDFVQNYSRDGTRKGSSGSPVIIDNPSFAGVAYFLHRHSGGGIDVPEILRIISQHRKAKSIQQEQSKQLQHKVKEMCGD